VPPSRGRRPTPISSPRSLEEADRLDVDRSEEEGDTASEVDRWEDEGGHDRAG
jgi:hypothetical protein